MPSTEQIRRRMADLGPLVDEIEFVGQEEDGSHWILGLEDGSALVVHLDEAAQKLSFTTDVATPAEEVRPALYEQLLRYNALWARTGGVRMAVDEPGGAVQQVYQLFRLDLDDSELARIVSRLISKARSWREYIRGFGAHVTDPPDDPTAAGLGVRV